MRQFHLSSLFKRNKRLTTQLHYRPHRSPLKSGYHFAFILITSLLLATCGLNRSLTIPLIQSQTPQQEIGVTAPIQTEGLETTLPAVTSQPGVTEEPVKQAAKPSAAVSTPSEPVKISTTRPVTPTATQPAATSTPGVLATSDLLFISDQRLLRWDHVTHYSSNLAENVVAFSTNATGSKIVLLRPRSISANGHELYDLDLLDFSSKQTRHLIEGTPGLLDLALSPDGAWLAYQYSPDGKPVISLLSLSEPTTPIILEHCEMSQSESCTPVSWSPDSRNLSWGDQRGLWVTSAGKGSASLLHTSAVDVPDPQGKTSQIVARFASPEWSPTGRFVLVQVIPAQSEASWHAVIDILTGKLAQVLDSYKLSPGQVSVSWLPNGRLAVARSSDPERKKPATIQVWDVFATNPDLLVSIGQYKFPSSSLSTEATSSTISDLATNTLQLDWIQQSNPGHLLFGAIQVDNPAQAGLYDLNLMMNSVTQLTQLTADVQEVRWAPDGSGILIVASDGKALFISADGKETFNLELATSSTLTGFVWLPPSLRK
jgi:hypothetical protein